MSGLMEHSLIKTLHRDSGITLSDLLDRKLFIEAPSEPCGHIDPSAWLLIYQDGLSKRETERLKIAVKQNPRLVRAAALVVANATGRHTKQQQRMAFDYARYTEAHEYELIDQARQAPLRDKADQQQKAKAAIQAEANELWENDTDKEFKTGEIAKLLHEKAVALAGTDLSLPVVKRWVSAVAPEFAKKGGRPKKTM